MKTKRACIIDLSVVFAVLCFVAVASVQSQDYQPKTNATNLARRQFVLDVLERKAAPNSNHAWVFARLISERLDTNHAFQAFLLKEPRRVFDALPVKVFRSSEAPLLWDNAIVEVRSIGSGGAELGVRVSSKDEADELKFITAGGTNHYLKTIENANHRCSTDEALERSAAKPVPPIANAAAAEMVTKLFWKLTMHYGYDPSEVLPPTVSTTNQFLVILNSKSGKEALQRVRVPCWTATLYSRTNSVVQGSGQADARGQVGFFAFALHQSDKSWKPTVIDFSTCPRADAIRPLVELADTFLGANWAENIYEDFMADPSKVTREVMARYQDNPHLRRELQSVR